MYHWWKNHQHCHKEHIDLGFWHVMSHYKNWYQSLWSHQNPQVDARKLEQYAHHLKKKPSCQHLTSWLYLNGFFWICKLSEGNTITSDHWNRQYSLDCQIKSHGGWVARVKFLHETRHEMAQSTTAHKQKNINDLHVELGHPSEVITCIITKSIGIQVTGMF